MPVAQYPKYAELAYNYSITKLGHPVITLRTYETMVRELATCLPLITQCQTDTSVCAQAQSVCNNAQIGPYEATGLNPYDIRIPCEVPGLCYDESHVTAFFNSAATQKALGVDQPWAACNYQVNGQFSSDWMKQFADPYVSSQLNAGTRVLIYAGDVGAGRFFDKRAPRLDKDRSLTPCPTPAPPTSRRLHLQLAWKLGVDARARLVRLGGLQRGADVSVDARGRHGRWRGAHVRRLHLPARLQRGPHGSGGSAQGRPRAAQHAHLGRCLLDLH